MNKMFKTPDNIQLFQEAANFKALLYFDFGYHIYLLFGTIMS